MNFTPTKQEIVEHIQKLGPKWRIDLAQVSLIQQILAAFQKHDDVILEAPTGIGKSIISVVVSSFFDTAYLATAEKILQKQYQNDFSCDLIMGADNYKCSRFDTSVANSPCRLLQSIRSECTESCKYTALRKKALTSSLLLSNYHYLILEFDFVKVFPKKEFVAFDEAHNAEMLLYDYAAVTFNTSNTLCAQDLLDLFQQPSAAKILPNVDFYIGNLRKALSLKPPVDLSAHETLTRFKDFYTILGSINAQLKKDLEAAIDSLDELDLTDQNLSPRTLGLIQFIKASWTIGRFNCKWSNYLENQHIRWLIDPVDDGAQLIPAEAGFYSKQTLQQMGSKRLWASATIGSPKTFAKAHQLTNYKVLQIPSPFPEENRRIYLYDRHRVNRNFIQSDAHLRLLMQSALEVIDLHKNSNGIIHSGTYALTRKLQPFIMPELEKRGLRVHFHDSPRDRNLHIDAFIKEGGILISPTITQGLDFKDSLSRFQILLKIPYLSLTSILIKYKMTSDSAWYSNKAAIQCIQFFGRSIRHKDDFADTYILDNNIELLKVYIPPWIKLDRYTSKTEESSTGFNLGLLSGRVF